MPGVLEKYVDAFVATVNAELGELAGRDHRNEVTIEAGDIVAAVIDSVERRLGKEGRLLVRYSGTEPLLRVMLEGRDQTEIDAWAHEIVAAAKGALGAG